MNGAFLIRAGNVIAAAASIAGLFLAVRSSMAERDSAAPGIHIQVAEAAAPRIRLRQSAELTPSPATAAGGSGRALASADFDEDGVPDLVAGSAAGDGGRLTLYRGNIDAIYPHSPEARARKERGEWTAAVFHRATGTLILTEGADFMGAGDFDADGHWDIVTASRGGNRLYWLRGDGRGNFESPKTIELDGAVTALRAGEVNRQDGLHDLVVGVSRADGDRALVFEGAEGALRQAPESLSLAAAATDIALGDLNNDSPIDIVLAAGQDVVVIDGRDRMLSLVAERQAEVPPAKMRSVAYGSAVEAITMGDFTGDSARELAVLTADGQLHVGDARSVAEVDRGHSRLVRARVSTSAKDDLLVLGGRGEMQVVAADSPAAPGMTGNKNAAAPMSVAASVFTSGQVVAALPMRLSPDAMSDVVLLQGDDERPVVIESHGNAPFVVNSTARTTDAVPGNGVCADSNGACTFAAAIEESNAHPGPDTIHFNIPGAGVPKVSTHASLEFTVLGDLNEPVTLDGTTQPAGRVEIDTEGFGPLVLYGGNSVLRGVSIYNQGASIVVASANNIIEGNYVGFRADGSKPASAPIGGIQFRGGVNSSRPGNDNLVGGTTAQARNVISNCDNPLNFPGTSGNVVQGNWVGLTVDGTAALPNGNSLSANDSPITIGGTTAGAGNVFAGATNQGSFSVGLNIGRASLIQGNKIGTNAAGTQAIPMRGRGIDVFTNETVTIGGTTPAARNVVAACLWGVQVSHDSGGATVIQGNYIGTNAAGTAVLPNSESGLILGGTRTVIIGGAVSGAGNLISGNAKNGVDFSGGINGTPNRGVVFQGNRVGTDASGTNALPNGGDGLLVGAATNLLVGGIGAGAANVISGNTGDGIEITYSLPPAANRIEGNHIGLNASGTGALGNGKHGIYLTSVADATIGGNDPGAGNRIAFNGGAGIGSSSGSDPFLGARILSNSIFSNRGLGLDRGEDGPTPYRNTNAQSPVITSVTSSETETVISGNLRTFTFGPQGPFKIQFFSNTSSDPSCYGEGQTYIGETTITAGGSVAVPFTATITPPVPPGRYITAVTIGQTDTQNNGPIYSSEFAFNVRAPGDPRNNPLQLLAVTPSVGGDTGVTTIKIVGEGIRQGATVILRRAGQPDIVGTIVNISADGSTIDAAFNLAGQPRGGGYEIVVANADGGTSSIANAFTIEQGRGFNVWADIVGPKAIRVGRPVRFAVTYGNNGNVDAPPTRLRVYIPRGLDLATLLPLEDGSLPAVHRHDAETVLEFFVPRIQPAGGASAVVVLKPQIGFANTGVPLRVVAISSPELAPATEIQVNADMALSYETLEQSATSEKGVLRVTSSTVDGEIFRETTITNTSEYRKPSLQEIQTENGLRYVAEYTIPQSLVHDTTSAAILQQATPPSATGFSGDQTVTPTAVGDAPTRAAAVSAMSITPTRAGGVVTATIWGQGLHSGMRVRLTRNGHPDVVARGVSAHTNGRSALVYFDLRGAALGVWNVVVTGSDRSTSQLNQAFTVEATYASVRDVVDVVPAGNAGEAAALIDQVTRSAAGANAGRGTSVAPPPAPGAPGRATQRGFSGTIGAIEGTRGPAGTSLRNNMLSIEQFYDYNPDEDRDDDIPSRTPEDEGAGGDGGAGGGGGSGGNTTDVDVVNSIDPNDKAGPQGAGAARYISGLDPLSYVILFENKPEATAPAQDVVITDQLDVSKFDLSTFQLGTVSFGKNVSVTPPPGLSEWTTDIDLRPAQNLLVRVSAALDKTTGVLTWRLISLDPATLQPTEDARAGFLPPNKNAPEGDGSVLFSIRAKPNQPAGSEIRNKARIIFDVNAPIDTPEYLNTIDNSVPTSQVEVLPATNTSSEFEVRWSGSDTGAGIETYSIYVSENGGAYRLWITTTATSGLFQGRPNASYAFYSVARDGGGNTEAAPLQADASTSTLSGQLLNIATRLRVQTGENVLIGGVIITGTDPKRVILRAIGPSLVQASDGALADPVMGLYQGDTLIAANDNWRDTQPGEIEETTIPPTNELESAIVQTLTPGFYTAVMAGKNGGTGIGVIEAYDLNTAANSKLGNIATRGFVGAGDDVMIGGLIAGGNGSADTRVLIRAIGPSLASAGITGALQDPTLDLVDGNGNVMHANDNWQESQQSEIAATTIPPGHAAESAIIATLPPGNYTAIVRGTNGGTGVALVEVYNVQ